MKIVVLQPKASKPNLYTIQVVDGGTIIHTENANGLAERDETVWRLADLYDALDIEVREKTKYNKEEFRFSEIPSIPVLDEVDASKFFEDNEEFVYDRMLQAVEEGIVTKRPFIRMFELSGTGVYITSIRPSWKRGLEQALQYYLDTENYEKCSVVKSLMNRL